MLDVLGVAAARAQDVFDDGRVSRDRLLVQSLKAFNEGFDGLEEAVGARGFRFPSTARLRSAMWPGFRGHHGQGLMRIRSSPCATKVLKSWSSVTMLKPPPTATAAR